MIKLAGYVNKRTFSVIRFVGSKPDFVPCYITNTLEKIEADINKRKTSNIDPRVSWVPHVLLDNGDWQVIDDNIRVFCK
jgi:hypothetical protein